MDLAPSSPAALDTLAKIAVDVGACEEAASLQRRAVDVASGERAERLREHLAAIEERCEGAPAAAPR